jgi:DNA-binding beta-propeller fold protein YncE
LLLLLAGLGALYYTLSRPAEVSGEGERDRNFLFSIYGFEGDLLRRPSSVAVGPNETIYVADTGKKRIVVFDRDGAFVTTYGTIGEGETDLWEPLGVAVAPDGRSFVVEKSKKKIVFFDAQRQPIKAVFVEEYPLSARVADDQLFITTESGVLISDLDGNLETGYIKRGKAPGEFDRPGAVAVGADGRLYVADSLNYRVQAIDIDGTPLWQYGQPLPEGATQNMTQDSGQLFGLPASITIDENGYLYVVDGLNSEIVVLDSENGELIEKIGDVGHDDGKFYYPDGIDHANGRLIIADKYNDRIEVFSVPTALGGADWQAWVPWLALLFLLPLLLLLFLRRKMRYVLTPGFFDRLSADEIDGETIAATLGKAFAAEDYAEAVADAEDRGLELVGRKVDEQRVAEIAERFALAQADAEAIATAVDLRGKRVLLTDDVTVAGVARELGLATLGYDEMLKTLHDERASDVEPGESGDADA